MIYSGIMPQMLTEQKEIRRKGTIFCKKMIGLLKAFISYGVNNASMMQIKFIYWMSLNINANIELYADSSEESYA